MARPGVGVKNYEDVYIVYDELQTRNYLRGTSDDHHRGSTNTL